MTALNFSSLQNYTNIISNQKFVRNLKILKNIPAILTFMDMNVEDLRDYCLLKPGATEEFPFGNDTLVFKVGGKVFLLVRLEPGTTFNAKCDPERAISLREQYPEIIPGFHMNKKHWNTVYMDGGLKLNLVHELIDHSYDLVLTGLSKNQREMAGL